MAAGGLLSLYAANHRLSNTHTAWETRSKFNQRRRKVRQHCSSAPREGSAAVLWKGRASLCLTAENRVLLNGVLCGTAEEGHPGCGQHRRLCGGRVLLGL